MTNELSPKVMRYCKICGLHALCYRGRAVCCSCFMAKKRELMPPLCELIGPKVFEHKRIRNNYQGAEYHRKWRARNKDKANEAARKYKEKVRSLLPVRKRAAPKAISAHESLLKIVATNGKCDSLNCKTCPLNYRETCRPKEILMDAERLLREKTIRD